MKLVTFSRDGCTAPGVWLDEGVLDLEAGCREAGDSADLSSMQAIVRGGDAALDAVARLVARGSSLVPHAQVQLEAPIALLRNVFCVGRNYKEHVEEGDRARGDGGEAADRAAVLHQGRQHA